MKEMDHKEDLVNVYLDGLKSCIKDAGFVYKKGYYDGRGVRPPRIKYRGLFGRELATIISHYNPASKKPLGLELKDASGEQDLDELVETIERELRIGVVVYK